MQTGALCKVARPVGRCIRQGEGIGTTALPARRVAGIQNTGFCQEVREAGNASLPVIVSR